MQVHRNSMALPAIQKAAITIGTFDGVHTGHQQVINQLKRTAAENGGESLIVTFDPHPRTVVNALSTIRLLNTIDEKIGLLEACGIDHLVIIPFTETFSAMSPAAYISEFLVKRFSPHTIVIGYDHHFGKNRAGDFSLLQSCATEFGYQLREIPAHVLNAVSVSSTRIRDAIRVGDMATANALLGYAYFFEATVVRGDQRGRTIGFPTANLEPDGKEKLMPGDGVYAVDVWVENEPFKGMMNIGYRPTVDGRRHSIEVHIFDFDRQIYGAKIRIAVKAWLRGEQKFDGTRALKTQLANDSLHARAVNSSSF